LTESKSKSDSKCGHSHAEDHSHDHEHDHDHEHGHGVGHHHHHHAPSSEQALLAAILITLGFMIVELLGGWFSNSLALLSDGAHMLTDAGGLLLSYFALWMAKRPKTHQFSYGYHRAEVLGALASGLTIWIVAGFLVYEAIHRMSSPPEVRGPLVVLVATVGLVANLMSMRMLHGAKEHSLNLKGAYLHIFADMLGSICAIISGVVIWWKGWYPIDPILSLLFAGLILISSWELIRESVEILMEFAPAHIDARKVFQALQNLPNISEVHDLHVWTVNSNRAALSVHLVSSMPEQSLESARKLLKETFGIHHSTIQVEHPDKFHREDCYDCEP